MRYLYFTTPILALLFFIFVYNAIEKNRIKRESRVVPKQEPEVVWNADEYLQHQHVKKFNASDVHQLLLKRTLQKPGVYLESLEPAMDTAGIEIVSVFHAVLGDDYTPVITSGNDWPDHKKNSKHYENKAIDFRIIMIPMEDRKKIVELAQERLKGRFRVLWEKGAAEHLHIEMLE